jgi:hypothetical protein
VSLLSSRIEHPTSVRMVVLKRISVNFATDQFPALSRTPMVAAFQTNSLLVRDPHTTGMSSE